MEPGSPGSLFSRVVRRMRGSAAPATPAVPEGAGNKEALQALLERKRRNDAIRQQEFAHLRQLRHRAQLGAHAQDSTPAAGSDFLASGSGQDARVAQTLQKIDAIEAQMSRQWWRGRPEAAPPQAPQALVSELPSLPPLPSVAAEGAQPVPAAPAAPAAFAPFPAPIPTLGLDSIYVPAAAAPFPALTGEAAAGARGPGAAATASAQAAQVHEPDLEEAAILFAHGDLPAAKARLLELLVQALDQQPPRPAYVGALWHALLDLYRAIGDADSFDALAIDYAAHFGRSAPLWFSMPQQLGLPPLGVPAPAASPTRGLRWTAPALMTVGAVAALDNTLATARAQNAPGPWLLSWRRLADVDEAALPRLTALLGRWAEQPEALIWADADAWLERLAGHTVLGESQRPAAWWLLRLAVLRCLGQEAQFEQLALDYCITYEVSPPAWSPPLQVCTLQQEEEEVSGLSTQGSLGVPPQALATAPAAAALDPLQAEGLAGVLEGDPSRWLQALAARAHLGEPLDIACDHLIRLDFVAAGSVLNWAADMQGQGHQLRFTQLHQLVAVFFRVIGIHEHAKVLARQA